MKNFIGRDQYNQTYHNLGAYPRKELLHRLGHTHADKMYVDKKDGSVVHIGYVIGGLWITLFCIKPFEKLQERRGER
jgi:hypothetical protein